MKSGRDSRRDQARTEPVTNMPAGPTPPLNMTIAIWAAAWTAARGVRS